MKTEEIQHWKWRLHEAEKIAAELPGKRFGVRGIYIIGSVKNAAAGPESDIDLLVHVQGTERHRESLRRWFHERDLLLVKRYREMTCENIGSLLDVHYITDADIRNRTSFAVHIDATTDRARSLKIFNETGG